MSLREKKGIPVGISANHKRVYRLYREEGLAMRIHNDVGSAERRESAERSWSIDFVSDCVSMGKVIRMLTIVDDCTARECPVIEVDTSLGAFHMRRVRDRMASERGLPEAIVVDRRPEFRGRALAGWLELIQPGKPTQNAYIESFNGQLREERS